MKLITVILLSGMIQIPVFNAAAQNSGKSVSRSLFQQNFLKDNVIGPQIKVRPLNSKSVTTMDSIFVVFQQSWLDYLKKTNDIKPDYDISVIENLDAYSYMWGFLSITHTLDMAPEIERHLFLSYMLPSLHTDYVYFKSHQTDRNLELLWLGSLKNTLTLGTVSKLSAENFHHFYAFYKDFSTTINSYQPISDKGVRNKSQIIGILDEYNIDMTLKELFFSNNIDSAVNLAISYIKNQTYSPKQAIGFARLVLPEIERLNKKDEEHLLLNSLKSYSAAGTLSADTLKKWQLAYDHLNGANAHDEMEIVKPILSYTDNAGGQLIRNEPTGDAIIDLKIKNAKFIFIDFWSLACGPCIDEIEDLNKFYEQIKDKKDFLFISINADTKDLKKNEKELQALINRYNIKFPVIFSSRAVELRDAFQVSALPAKFIINAGGQVLSIGKNSPTDLNSFTYILKTEEK